MKKYDLAWDKLSNKINFYLYSINIINGINIINNIINEITGGRAKKLQKTCVVKKNDFCDSALLLLKTRQVEKEIYYFLNGIMVSKNEYKKYKMKEALK